MTDAVARSAIAAAARDLVPELELRVRLYADALAQSLARELWLVAWDREQLIGGLALRLQELAAARIPVPPDGPLGLRIIERTAQPLESIDAAWRALLAGCRVRLEHEVAACSAAVELLRGMGRVLARRLGGVPVLEIASAPLRSAVPPPSASASSFRIAMPPQESQLWPLAGPPAAHPRVGVVGPSADPELAAYVLARSSLRRTGLDPRGVHLAYVVEPTQLLRRHLVRVFLGATMGPATSASSFAGPVTPAMREDFLAAHEAWSHHPAVDVWCPGGDLERSDPSLYLAPSLFRVDWPAPDLPLSGPLLVLVRCTARQAENAAFAARADGSSIIAIGAERLQLPSDATWIRGALLVERLPPGLPEPRPA